MFPITLVNPESKMHDDGSVTMSPDTIGASVNFRYPFNGPSDAAAR